MSKNDSRVTSSETPSTPSVSLEFLSLGLMAMLLITILSWPVVGIALSSELMVAGVALILVVMLILVTWKWHLKDPSIHGMEIAFTPVLISLVLLLEWYVAFIVQSSDYLIVGEILGLLLFLYIGRIVHWERLLIRSLYRLNAWIVHNKERSIGIVQILLSMLIFSGMWAFHSADMTSDLVFGITLQHVVIFSYLLLLNGALNVLDFYQGVYRLARQHPLVFRGVVSGFLIFLAILGIPWQQWVPSLVLIVLAAYVAWPVIVHLLPEIRDYLKQVRDWLLTHIEQSLAILEALFVFTLPFWGIPFLGNLLPLVMIFLFLDAIIHSVAGYQKTYLYFKDNPVVFRAMMLALSFIVFLAGLYSRQVILTLMAAMGSLLAGYPFIFLAGKKLLEFLERTWNWLRVNWLLLARLMATSLGMVLLIAGLGTQNPWFVTFGILVVCVANVDVLYPVARHAYHVMMLVLTDAWHALTEALRSLKKALKNMLRVINENKGIILRALLTIGGLALIIGGVVTNQHVLILIGLVVMLGVNATSLHRLAYHAYLFLRAEGLMVARFLLMFIGGVLILVGSAMASIELVGIGIIFIITANIHDLLSHAPNIYKWLVTSFKRRPLDVSVTFIDSNALVGYLAGIWLRNDLVQQACVYIIVLVTVAWAFIRLIVFVYKNTPFIKENWIDILRTVTFTASIIFFIAAVVQANVVDFLLGTVLLLLTVADRIYCILRNVRMYLANFINWLSPWVRTVLHAIGALLALGSASQVLLATVLPKEYQIIPLPAFSLIVRLSISIVLGLVGAILIWQAYLVRPDEETRQKSKFASSSTLSSELPKKRSDSV